MRVRLAAIAAALALVSAAAGAQVRPPKLLVVLVVDQMRGDYVDKFQHQWTGGLHRLVEEGAWFRQTDYPYFSTVTCPGHATIGSGSLPSTHGVILNGWWDRKAAATVTCTEDSQGANIGYGKSVPGGESAARLLVPALADELRAQRGPVPQVISFSLKARSAIMLGGHHPDAVTWFDDSGAWTTSTAFSPAPVPDVADYIARHPVERDLEKVWTPSLSADAYLYENPAVGVKPGSNMSASFPHALADASGQADRGFYARWQSSPFADEYLARMALAVADARGFGRAPGPNMLAVSFSTLDRVGHDYGPNSHEVQDVLVRLDRTLGDLFDGLDRLIGAGEYTVALSADHGVAPVPQRAQAQGLDAGRLSGQALRAVAERSLATSFGPGDYVAQFASGYLYLKAGVYERLQADGAALDDLRRALMRSPSVTHVYTRDELLANRVSRDPLARRAALSYFPERSGDVMVLFKPYWIDGGNATTHGTGYGYDTRVPLLLKGKGIVPGQYFEPASPADIAPTLAVLAGVTLAGADGRVLVEALGGR